MGYLANTGHPISALKVGQVKSTAQIEQELRTALEKTAYLSIARIEYGKLDESAQDYIFDAITTIKTYLDAADKSFSALNPTGKESDKEIQQKIDSIAQTKGLKEAREIYDKLLNAVKEGETYILETLNCGSFKHDKTPEDFIEEIYVPLNQINQPLSAVDATGKSDDEDIKYIIQKSCKRLYCLSSCNTYVIVCTLIKPYFIFKYWCTSISWTF